MEEAMPKKENVALPITDYLAAGYSGFVVTTVEAKRAQDVIVSQITQHKRKDGGVYTVKAWDMDSASKELKTPDAIIRKMKDLPEFTVAILHNYHWFLDKPPIIQLIQNSMEGMSSRGQAIVILAPKADIPIEIRKDFMILDLPLPDEKEILECMEYVATSVGSDLKTLIGDANQENVIQAAKGLSKTEIENVLALSASKTGKFDIGILNEQKINTIEKSGLIEVLRTDKTYADILGYDQIKRVVTKMINKRESKGVLIVGPPGCGKTLFMECTVGEFNKIGIVVNFGRLYSKFQGEGSQNVEEIIRIIEAIGDCVVFMDEFEKQFSGADSSGEGDSGNARRMTGRWLEFMQNKPEGVYLMGTCNSFKGIPPEYIRPGRFDSTPFYIDIPTESEKEAILGYYIDKFALSKDQTSKTPEMPRWTGAEIEACCLMAKNLGCSIAEATSFIKPQADNQSFKDAAEELRQISIPATSIEVKNGGKKQRRVDALEA
jgi:SpoVK/Ycf46/Vps4 family AAA+-type ATPase